MINLAYGIQHRKYHKPLSESIIAWLRACVIVIIRLINMQTTLIDMQNNRAVVMSYMTPGVPFINTDYL